MAFNRLDIQITVAMLIMLIAINFAFPVLGLSTTETNQSDIPDFNLSRGTVVIDPGVPDYPSRPSEGTLTYRENAVQYQDNRQVYLRGDSNDGISITLVNFDPVSDPQPKINLNKFNPDGSTVNDQKNINESEFKTLSNHSYTLAFENVEETNISQPNYTVKADFRVVEQPADSHWSSRIPVVGGIIGSTSQVAAVVGWIGALIWYPIEVFIRFSTTVGNVLFNIISFIFGLGFWLLSTYSSIIGNAPTAYISLILSIPGLVLSIQFARMIYQGVKLAPLT